jgi:chaperonin cofactor prefoldin
MIQIESCRKKMSSLEKDRQDLQSTIDALQEGIHT